VEIEKRWCNLHTDSHGVSLPGSYLGPMLPQGDWMGTLHSIDTELTLTALRMALEERRPLSGCIHHSDRGVQYASYAYVDELRGVELFLRFYWKFFLSIPWRHILR